MPLNEVTSNVKSEREHPIQKAVIDPSSSLISGVPENHLTKFRNIKLSNGNSDASLKTGIPKETLSASKPNGSAIESADLKTIKTNSVPLANITSVDRSSNDNKPEAKNSSVKPAYFKSDNVDPASIRKPGILSQVMPKRLMGGMSSQPSSMPNKEIMVEQPKQEPPKQEPPKQEPLKQEPPKQEPPKQAPPKQEPPKQEQSKQETIEAIRIQNKIELTPAVSGTCSKKDDSPAEVKKPQQNEVVGPWMKPCPVEENAFVDVVVQYVAPDNTTWVSLVKHENANNQLLRDINKNISVTTTPSPTDIKVHSLFLVPFEDIYYRGMVLQPISAKDTVLVRLIDFGNEFHLPVGQLKIPLPSMLDHNAYAFAVKFENPRSAEIGNVLKIRKESMDQDVMTVTVQSPIITMKDVDVVPLPVGVKKNLVCLDFSNVGMGYVSACISDKKAIQFVEETGPKMTDHCASSKDVGYSPQVNELCFAKFEDGQWYRAVTLKVIDSDKFGIMFIDYGYVG